MATDGNLPVWAEDWDEETVDDSAPVESRPDESMIDAEQRDQPVNQTITLPSAEVPAEPPKTKSPSSSDGSSPPNSSEKQ